MESQRLTDGSLFSISTLDDSSMRRSLSIVSDPLILVKGIHFVKNRGWKSGNNVKQIAPKLEIAVAVGANARLEVGIEKNFRVQVSRFKKNSPFHILHSASKNPALPIFDLPLENPNRLNLPAHARGLGCDRDGCKASVDTTEPMPSKT
jgi:hypothetical protein